MIKYYSYVFSKCFINERGRGAKNMGIKLRRKKGKMAILSALVFSMVGSFCMNNITHAEDIEITSPVTDADGEVTWDKVQFGSYYQTAKFSPEPIRWRILSIDESTDTAYVMANNVLEAKAYDEGQAYVTWENCSLRNWLNNEFYNTAFNDLQKALIETTTVDNSASSTRSSSFLWMRRVQRPMWFLPQSVSLNHFTFNEKERSYDLSFFMNILYLSSTAWSNK